MQFHRVWKGASVCMVILLQDVRSSSLAPSYVHAIETLSRDLTSHQEQPVVYVSSIILTEKLEALETFSFSMVLFYNAEFTFM